MNTHTERSDGDRSPGTKLTRGIGLHGRVIVFWAMAGGIGLGGFLVGALTLTGRLSANALFLTATGLFLIGAFMGLAHGGVLGYFGRGDGVDSDSAVGGLLRGALYAVPGLAVAWLVTIWIAMAPVAMYAGEVAPWIGVGVGWAAGLILLAVATWYGFRALRNAYARWPERRLGTALVAGVYMALMATFLADRPELWGLRLRVTEVGAVLLATGATLWIGGPLVTMALQLIKRIPGSVPVVREGSGVLKDVGLGLATGLVVALLVIPFAPSSGMLAAGAAGSVVMALSQALVDEVLLRLFVVTAVAWLALRWHRVRPKEAAVLSVAAAAMVQVLLYMPGVSAIGFPTTVTAMGFILVAVLIPALVFGALFWTRGFTSALVADATALASLAILAV